MYKLVSDCHARPAAADSAPRPRRALAALARGLPVCACAAGLLIAANAAADGEPLAALTGEALALDQTARALEDTAPADTYPIELYFGERSNGLLLRYVSAQVDNNSPIQYEYSDAEALALARGGLHRLLSAPLTPGSHRLRIDYIARDAHGLPGDPRVRGHFDQKFETSSAGRWVEAELQAQGYLDKTPEVKLRTLSAVAASAVPVAADDDARSKVFAIGSNDDPRVRLTRLLLAEDRPFSAASELLYLQAHCGVALPGSFAAQLASILGDLGQRSRAEALLRTLPQSDTAMLESAAQQAPAPAQSAQTTPTDSVGWALRDQANLSLGYAQLRSNQGAAAIDSFGRVRAQGPFSARGLLGLGWAYLDSGDADGKHATAANDAAVHVSAVSLRPSFTADVERRQRRGALHTTPPSSAQLQALRRALVPWTELIGRNPMDPAVQEGLLAIAYALDHTGAFEDAQRFYQRSVKLQETTLARLDSALTQVNDGRMLAAIARGAGNGKDSGWHWQLPDVPADSHWWLTLNDDPQAPDNFYFEQLLSDADFNAALSQYHQVQALIAAGDEHLQRLAHGGGDAAGGLPQQLQALKPRLLAASTGLGEQLKTVALADLQQQKRQAEAYLVEGRFALARSNDWVPAEVAKK